MLEIGLTKDVTLTVQNIHTAKSFGSGSVDVLSTPQLIALMENAAMEAVSQHLEEGFATVGTKISVEHISATPLGMNVTAKASLVNIENRKLSFEISAFDEAEKIAFGTHERFIIHEEKFVNKTNSKIK